MDDIAPNLDDVILSRPRLSILAALISGDEVDFTFLQKNLDISDGNLSTHLRKLEAEKYILAKKAFVGRKPKTFFSITSEGRNGLERLLKQLEELLGTAQPAKTHSKSKTMRSLPANSAK